MQAEGRPLSHSRTKTVLNHNSEHRYLTSRNRIGNGSRARIVPVHRMYVAIFSHSHIMYAISLVGDITIPGGMTLAVNSDLNGASPQFTLTCISTGGPATTVTWTRDSATAMGDEMTVFNDVTTAQYTHTLTVIGRLGGDYQCTVSNVKPSSASASFRIQGTAYMYAQTLTHNIMCM